MKFLISAGHGGTDPGACANGHTESQICTEVRDAVAARLIELRHTATTDGGKGINLPLAKALRLIGGVDVAVELHCNGAANIGATGVEVIAPIALKPMAQRIARAIAAETGQRLRGQGGWIDQAQSQHKKLAWVQAGGIIVEMVFVTNPVDLAAFLKVKERLSHAIAGALCGYEVGK